jgi:predicted DNA-binding ribbon-helix-helix protein
MSSSIHRSTCAREGWAIVDCRPTDGAERRAMKSDSPVIKRSIVIHGHKTSISVEDDFWNGLKEIAEERDITIAKLVQEIDQARDRGNLSSAIRVYVLRHFRQRFGSE